MAVTTAAVVGIAAGGGQAVMGFMNAAKQKQAAAKAEKQAKKMMADARRKAETDHYAGLDVPLDAYEAEVEANLAADKQAIEALQEGDARALAAGVGRVGAQQAAETEKTRIAMGDEMANLDKMKADSKEAIKQQLIGMDVGEAQMQDQRAREAEQARASAIQSGFAGIGKMASGVGELAPLYGRSRSDARASKIYESLDESKMGGKSRAEALNIIADQGYTGKDYRGMRKGGFQDFDYSIFGG